MKITRRRVEDAMKENSEDCILLGGSSMGEYEKGGARNWKEDRADGKRKSKDKVENAEGKGQMEWIEENGWELLNGNKQWEEGDWTYRGCRVETVIDYGIVNEEAWESVESDHLEIALRKRRGGKEQRRKGVEDRNKTVYFLSGIAVLCLKCNQESENP
jgi:hypothetical protein